MVSTEGDVRVNDKNKRIVPCFVCGEYFEQVYGLGTHLFIYSTVKYSTLFPNLASSLYK